MKVAYVGLVPPDPGGIAQHGAATIAALGRRVDDLHVEAWHTPYPRALHPVGASRGDPGNDPARLAHCLVSAQSPNQGSRRVTDLVFPT